MRRSARTVRALPAWSAALLLLLARAPGVVGQVVPVPLPPLPGGYSALRLEVARPPRLAIPDRAMVPALLLDVALNNSRTRVGAVVVRYSGISGPAPSSLGAGLSLTRVLVDTETPARLGWVTAGAARVRLDHELLTDAAAWSVLVSGGLARRYTPPAIGELLLTLAPRLEWRRITEPPVGLDRDAAGAGLVGAIDWGSQGRLGALAAVDLEWLSSRPPGLAEVQLGFRVGLSFRLLVFPRAHPMPPPEGP